MLPRRASLGANWRHEPVGASGILVTGAPRSGTTWIGDLVGAAEALQVIHEPLNPDTRWLSPAPARHFVRLDDDPEAVRAFRRVLDFRRPAADLFAARSRSQLAKAIRLHHAMRSARRLGARPLVKDPIALLSTDWLHENFGLRVVFVLRHPAGFVSSLNRLGWRTDFASWLDDPRLTELLPESRAELDAAANGLPMIEEAIVLYNALHEAIAHFERTLDVAATIRYDDVAAEPATQIERLCHDLDVPFDAGVKQVLDTSTAGPAEVDVDLATSRRPRDRSAATTWRTRLSGPEVALVRERTERWASRWWSDADWRAERRIA